jgi:aspartyl/glutamyl-tRNA(Asn/Gln) amidotransferase C subunit
MTISRDDVSRVAELAYLELTPDEAEMYRGHLNYVGKLQQLDLTNVVPMTQMSFATGETVSPLPASNQEVGTPLRDDIVHPCTVANAVLSQAPDAIKPFFRVPKVIER